jgi:PAS domain S-box-containing protein
MNDRDKFESALVVDLERVSLLDLFSLEELQRLQDLFADAHEVASLITHPDGSPITNPRNFTRLCKDIIRTTEKGCTNCFHSDAILGRNNPAGPIIQPCLSGGLLDAGVSITVGGKHIANWLIGQVRNDEMNEAQMLTYADQIGANREDFKQALNEVPKMSVEKFNKIAQLLFAFANELSAKSYNKLKLQMQIVEYEIVTKQLEENRENLSTTLSSIGDGVISIDISGLIVNMNPIAEKLCGWKLSGAKGRVLTEVFNIINAETRENISNPVKKVLENGEIFRFETHKVLINRKGEEFHIADSAAPIRDKKGNITGAVLVFSDVTEKYIAQKKLKDSEEKFKKAFQNSSDSININLRDGTYINVNDGFTNLTGFTQKDVAGKLTSEIDIWVIPEDLKKFGTGLRERGFVKSLESKFRCKDGSVKTAIISSEIIMLNNEPHILTIARDITERKQMEELILKSKQQYENLVSNIPVGVYILRTKSEGTFALDYASPRMAEMLDLSIESLNANAENVFKAIHPDDLEGFVRLNQEGIQKKQPFDWKGRAIIKGVVRWLHVRSKPQELENGDTLWHGLIVDITERMIADAEIRYQNKELVKLNAEKDKFFSIIAHDLRSPFNSFLGLTQIMAEELPSLTMAEVQEIAVKMSKSATNLYRLLENLLEWSQIKNGTISFYPEIIQLSSVVNGCIEIMNVSARNKNIEIVNDIAIGIEVLADRNMIQTIIRNLVSNALKFTPKGGKVNFSAKISGNQFVEITIKDSGIGMSQVLIDNLFRIDMKTNRLGTENEPSSGLGLLLCKEFVEKQGGKIWVKSEVGKGSMFSFSIPIA